MTPPNTGTGRTRPTVAGTVALGLAAILVVSACGGDDRRGDPNVEGPNVLVVVLDACRADKCSCLDFDKPTAPTHEELATDPDGVVFSRYYVHAPWTKPSTASLFTGLYVNEHGVVVGRQEKKEGAEVYATQALHEDFDTMAEMFQRAGYFTWGATRNHHLDPVYGFGQGIDDYRFDGPYSDWEILKDIQSILKRRPGPFFGYIHFSACHNPFPDHRRDDDYMEEFGFDYDVEARKAEGIDFTTPKIKHAIRDGSIELEPDDVRFLNLLYESQMRNSDLTLLAPIVKTLRDTGQYDDTVIVVTADHGEELYDHGSYGHQGILWETVVHVPLVIKFAAGQKPAEMGARVDDLARAVDILPTVLQASGLPLPDHLSGRSLLEGRAAQFSIFEIQEGRGFLADNDHKLIALEGEPMLFDLAADPNERNDLAAEMPDRVAELLAEIERVLASRREDLPTAESVDTALEGETLEQLKSLGYVE